VAPLPKNERGFILIGAIWLLVLCGSIAAILTLRARDDYVAAADEQREMTQALALDAALETILADILFNGPRSRWGMVPVERRIAFLDQPIDVRISSELGRIDLNEANPALVDRALGGLGVGASDRTLLLGSLAARRTARKPIASWDELQAILPPGRTGGGESGCIEEHFTIFSALATPQEAAMPAPLARALGSAAAAGGPAATPAVAGTPLRIELKLPAGPALTAWVRVTGLIARPYSTSGFQRRKLCG
jgi:general secretion pathway protein K